MVMSCKQEMLSVVEGLRYGNSIVKNQCLILTISLHRVFRKVLMFTHGVSGSRHVQTVAGHLLR